MAKTISYANMKLKINNNKQTFLFQDNEIEVLQYLPIEDKYDLIMVTLQKSYEEGIYNPIKLDMFFHLYLVYMYTNISFTEKQKEDEAKIYDTLKSNGFIEKLLEKIPENEYNDLLRFIEENIENKMKYSISAASIVNKIIGDLPKQAQAAMDIVNSFDKDKFQAVKDFAEAANGGRPIAGTK